MFGDACLPGSATAAGCPANKQIFTIVIPWHRVMGDYPGRGRNDPWNDWKSWTAPGGNRYYWESLPNGLRDPRVISLIQMMAHASKYMFQKAYNTSNWNMSDLLARGEWKTSYGAVSVPILPLTGEKAKDFVARGGYLLDLRPDASPFLSKRPIFTPTDEATYTKLVAAAQRAYFGPMGAHPPEKWMPDFYGYELWGFYAPTATATMTLRIVQDDALTRGLATIFGSIGQACAAIQDPRAALVVAGATAVPAAAPMVSAYKTAATICNLPNLFSSPPCIPLPPEEGGTPPPFIPIVDDALIKGAPTLKKQYAASIATISPGANTLAPESPGADTPAPEARSWAQRHAVPLKVGAAAAAGVALAAAILAIRRGRAS